MENIFYYAQVYGFLNSFGVILAILFGIAFFVLLFNYIMGSDDKNEAKRVTKGLTGCIIALLLSIGILIFVPTKDTYLLMQGGKVINSIIENRLEVPEPQANTVILINDYIKTATEKLKQQNYEMEIQGNYSGTQNDVSGW